MRRGHCRAAQAAAPPLVPAAHGQACRPHVLSWRCRHQRRPPLAVVRASAAAAADSRVAASVAVGVPQQAVAAAAPSAVALVVAAGVVPALIAGQRPPAPERGALLPVLPVAMLSCLLQFQRLAATAAVLPRWLLGRLAAPATERASRLPEQAGGPAAARAALLRVAALVALLSEGLADLAAARAALAALLLARAAAPVATPPVPPRPSAVQLSVFPAQNHQLLHASLLHTSFLPTSLLLQNSTQHAVPSRTSAPEQPTNLVDKLAQSSQQTWFIN